MRNRKLPILASLSAALVGIAVAQDPPAPYNYYPLPDQKGNLKFILPVAINNNGEILYQAQIGDYNATAGYLVEDSDHDDFDFFPWGHPDYAIASAMNCSRLIGGNDYKGGFYLKPGGDYQYFNVFHTHTPTLYALNDKGDSAGTFDNGEGFIATCDYDRRVNVPGAKSTKVGGLNNDDEACGSYMDGNGKTHGFTLDEGLHYVNFDHALYTECVGINDHDIVVGNYQVDGHGQKTWGAFALKGGKYYNFLVPAPDQKVSGPDDHSPCWVPYCLDHYTVKVEGINNAGVVIGQRLAYYVDCYGTESTWRYNFVAVPK